MLNRYPSDELLDNLRKAIADGDVTKAEELASQLKSASKEHFKKVRRQQAANTNSICDKARQKWLQS